jgi:hypothetical protein
MRALPAPSSAATEWTPTARTETFARISGPGARNSVSTGTADPGIPSGMAEIPGLFSEVRLDVSRGRTRWWRAQSGANHSP